MRLPKLRWIVIARPIQYYISHNTMEQKWPCKPCNRPVDTSWYLQGNLVYCLADNYFVMYHSFLPFLFTSALPHFITSFEFKVLSAIHFRYSDNPEITSSFVYVPEPFSIHMFTIYCNFYIPDHSWLLMPFRSILQFRIRSRPFICNCSAPICI